MKVYIAGPMTGYVDHNFPAFHAAAAHLRANAFVVVSPAELDDPSLSHEELRAIPHHVYMKRDIEILLTCDLIYMLPGWKHSKGATLEATVAKGCGIRELQECDVDLWRSFEGDPIIEPAPPSLHVPDCDAVEGDETGNAWCSHGVQVGFPECDRQRGTRCDRGSHAIDGKGRLVHVSGRLHPIAEKPCPRRGCNLKGFHMTCEDDAGVA